MNKQKITLTSLFLLSAIAFFSCTSTAEMETVYTNTLKNGSDDLFENTVFWGTSLDDTQLINPKNYEVLGPVVIRATEEAPITGYADILEAAIKKYPNTSAVINIVKDSKETFKKEDSVRKSEGKKFIAWSGVAIKITDTYVLEYGTTTNTTRSANGDTVTVTSDTETYKKLQ